MDSKPGSGFHSTIAKTLLAMAGLTLLNISSPVLAEGEGADQTRARATTGSTESQESVKTLLRIGISKHRIGDDVAAEAFFQKALASDSENPDALYNLGAIAENRGDLQLALKYYRAALKSNPSDQDLRSAAQEVQNSLAERAADGNSPGRKALDPQITANNVMPPKAPSFALTLPANRNQYQFGLPSQTAMSRQLPPSEATQASRPLGHDLMRAALGVARLLNHDTCSLCGGLLRRW